MTSPKSSASQRSIRFGLKTAAALGEQFQASSYKGDEELVFGYPELGTPLDPSELTRSYLKPALKAAGIEKPFQPWHGLRHAALMFYATTDAVTPPMVQARAGHSQYAITERYVHAPQVVAAGVERAEERIFRGGAGGLNENPATVESRFTFVKIEQLALDESPTAELVSRVQEWKHDYPWLHRALTAIGPGAHGASEGWRIRIQDELRTTLDFKVRPDHTAAVWCGLSGYEFHHYPTPKELFEGLAEAYRREVKRIGGHNPWRMSDTAGLAPPGRAKVLPSIRAMPQAAADSLIRAFGALLLLRTEQLMLIFLAVMALTLALSTVAILVAR
jgi:Phage integrase family